MGRKVGVFLGGVTGILLLESITTTPDTHGDDKENEPVEFGSRGPRKKFQIQKLTKDKSANHLHEPIEQTVERPGTNVEVGAIDTVEVVSIEPVTRQKHGKEQDDVVVGAKSLIETEEFRFPGRVLHRDDAGTVLAHDVLGVRKKPGEDESQSHENHEGDVSPVIDRSGARVHILAQGNLCARNQ